MCAMLNILPLQQSYTYVWVHPLSRDIWSIWTVPSSSGLD
jgi:hypothetical protein